MTKKLKNLYEKLKAGLLTEQAMVVNFDNLKKMFSELAALEQKQMAEKNPAPNFSSWPPEMPERSCDWRLSDEVQQYRLSVPEPSHLAASQVRYIIPQDFPFDFSMAEPSSMSELKTGSFEKKMFCTEDGSRFVAWTADGQTPIFPIPL